MEERKIGKTLHILGVLRHGYKVGSMEVWKYGRMEEEKGIPYKWNLNRLVGRMEERKS